MNVDRKKLAKANAKAQEKQQKRETDGTTQVRKRPEKMLATASQAMNRRGVKEDGSGGTKDIRLEGVDISIGTKQILHGAEMLLVYGHKYGLVGRNGIGKTTLIKMIAWFEFFILYLKFILAVNLLFRTISLCWLSNKKWKETTH